MSRPIVSFCRCGTKESWEKARKGYTEMNHVVPGEIYVSDDGLCLVTSQEWVDWLTGRTDIPPFNNSGILRFEEL